MCTLEKFLAYTKKIGVCAVLNLHYVSSPPAGQNGCFKNGLSISTTANLYLRLAVFLETIPYILFQSISGCWPIYLLFFSYVILLKYILCLLLLLTMNM